MRTRILAAVSAIALTTAGAAQAAVGYAVTDLNLRAGPGPQYEVLGVIDAEAATDVVGCLPEANWCKVIHDGQEGWAYGDYLTASLVAPLPIYDPASELQVGTVTYTTGGEEGAAVGALTGAVAGAALLGGPLAIVGGAMLGGGLGASADVEERTITYIHENPLDPVYAEGEVVVGATLEGEAELVPIPDSDYAYIALNNTVTVVDPDTRRIVYILR
ncbi:DUF1236 domain-containing protein [Maliponia aquimaris]|uniref:Bacterial SH3 domain protein n=1 Tax=Maliponia aquimaris TaxID=1673631 RepID=A0A238K179_9RHOB|nr:DUF1236 domain-containing protein [Maliponia aquimaris]SMX36668.1 Bacterial SH3 domain protein [Maliponia aquimaris]